MTQSNFLNRWARKKAGNLEEPTKEQTKVADSNESAAVSPVAPDSSALSQQAPDEDKAASSSQTPPPPTMEDVEKMDAKAADFSAFMRADVDPSVQQAAMKKMFSDPHFNVMDGLDIYIDDYTKSDPIPLDMLKRMNQSDLLGIFKTTDELYPEFKDSKKESQEDISSAPQASPQAASALPDSNPSNANQQIDIESSDSDLKITQNQQTGERQTKPDSKEQ